MAQTIADGPLPLAWGLGDASRRLGVGLHALHGLIERKEIRAFKIGSKTLVAESELQNFIAQQSAGEIEG